MEASSEANLYAPPQAQVSDITPVSDGQVLATRRRRLAGGTLDALMIMLAIGAVALVTHWNPIPAFRDTSLTSRLTSSAIGLLVFLVLNGYLLWARGQTLGKAMLGMRIVRPDGAPVSLGRLVALRYGVGSALSVIPMLSQIFGLLDGLLVFRASRQCLHDQIADTVVIKL